MSDKTYRFRVGNFECIAVQDDEEVSPVSSLFPDKPEAERNEAVTAIGFDPDALSISYTCLAINTGQTWMLIDTGYGFGREGNPGHVLENLKKAGVEPKDISSVLLSHAHFDHYGGFTDTDGNLTFPHAQHYVWKGEWDFYTSSGYLAELESQSPERAAMVHRFLLPIQPNLVLLDEQNPNVVPGIRAMPTPGHTFAHVAFMIESNNERLLYIGDAIVHPVYLRKPDWVFGYDYDKDQSAATRRQLATMAVEQNLLVLSYHFEFPSLGYIQPDGDVWRWQPIE